MTADQKKKEVGPAGAELPVLGEQERVSVQVGVEALKMEFKFSEFKSHPFCLRGAPNPPPSVMPFPHHWPLSTYNRFMFIFIFSQSQ